MSISLSKAKGMFLLILAVLEHLVKEDREKKVCDIKQNAGKELIE